MASEKLSEYASKRRFEHTPEPAPVLLPAAGPLLFVVQQHGASRLHYDLRLECDGVLKSWAVPKGPSLELGEKRLAMATEDHPCDYAAFEGVIPAGQYGAGGMIVWDIGVYSPDEGGTSFADRGECERRVRDALAQGKLSFQLRGTRLKGSFALVRTAKAPTSWLLLKHRDRFAGGEDLGRFEQSVISGLSLAQVKSRVLQRHSLRELVVRGRQTPMPKAVAPMLADTADAVFARPGWRWEPKLDGYRLIALVEGDAVRLSSRRGIDLAGVFPGLVAQLREQARDGMILDGELVALGSDGRPSFNALQNRVQAGTARDIAAAERACPVIFFCFDLLYFAGVDLRAAAYRHRRRFLEQCLLPSPLLQIVHAASDGAAMQAAALASGFEGVLGKREDARYEAGRRSAAWIKVKASRTGEFVIGGYTRGSGSRDPLGAILVGRWANRRLHYASHVGSGFDERLLADLKPRLDALRRSTCPFAETPERKRPTTWVEPRLVAEVRFHSETADGRLREPVFMRLREDVDPRSVRSPSRPRAVVARSRAAGTSEADSVLAQLDTAKSSFDLEVGPHRIRLTHLERVYWPASPALGQPAQTKRDLLRYFARVSTFMLPHLANRPLTMIRMPDGIAKQRFYQKHWAQQRPAFVDTLTVFSAHKDEDHEVLVCNNLATLLWLAQAGTLELHVWHSRARGGADVASAGSDYASSLESLAASTLNYPDYVLFDLDPYIYSGEEKPGDEPELNTVAFEKGKEVAFWLRELLHSMSLDAIVKTSGKTGLHVFVPIRRTIDFDAARHVSELVGRHLQKLHPQDITLEWSIPKRTGKIFMDYNMNVRGKTLNCAYSPRGVAGAPVSMPLTWEELADAHPLDFRLDNAAQRLAETGDRWRDALQRKQSLERALKAAKV